VLVLPTTLCSAWQLFVVMMPMKHTHYMNRNCQVPLGLKRVLPMSANGSIASLVTA
jgi:hypothetical protein